MPEFTLHYFNLRGRGQLMRLLFAQSQVKFTDHQTDFADWPAEKKNSDRYPFGTMPTLEVDGKILPETVAIARYLANELGLNGKSNWEKAWCDVYVDVLGELKTLCTPFVPFFRKEKDDVKFEKEKNEVFDTKVTPKLVILEGFLKSNNSGKGFCVGDEVTWADLFFVDMSEALLNIRPTCLDGAPLLKELYDRVLALPKIKAFMDARPPAVV